MAKATEYTIGNTVDYAGFAELAGVSVQSLWQYAQQKPDPDKPEEFIAFPEPVTIDGIKYKRFATADAEAYVQARAERWRKNRADVDKKRRGRPPKAADDRIRYAPADGERLKQKLKDADMSVLSLSKELGYSRRAIVQRLEGLSGWQKPELEHVARILKVKVSDVLPR